LNFDAQLLSTQALTTLLKDLNINSWKEACIYVSKLPYGRNSNRHDLSLVLREQKGSCSSKHAFLKQVAIENDFDEIQLILCLYKMNIKNTPKIAKAWNPKFDYIPEAHCYISLNGIGFDFTSSNSNLDLIKEDIVQEIQINPEQVNEFKENYHKSFILEWINQEALNYSFDELWQIREQCIAAIANER